MNFCRIVQLGVGVLILLTGMSSPVKAAADYVPTVFAVHEKFVQVATPEEIKDTQDIYWRSGIFSTTNGQIRASSCDSSAKASVVIWRDEDIIKLGNDRKSELTDKKTPDRLKELEEHQKLPSSAVKSSTNALTLDNPWAIYSANTELLNLIKAYVLLHEHIAPANSTLAQLATVQLPMVVIMVPAPGIYDPHTAGLKGTTVGQTTRNGGSNFIVLAYAAVIPVPKGIQGIITDALPHEIAHYLGVPHVFVQQSDLDDRNPDIQRAAKLIRDAPDCGFSQQYASPPAIKDVDYLRSQDDVGDTLPMWLENDPASRKFVGGASGDRCNNAYKDVTVNDPAMRPDANLMHYLRRYKLLTPMQLSHAHKVLTAMQRLPAPVNLCASAQ